MKNIDFTEDKSWLKGGVVLDGEDKFFLQKEFQSKLQNH